MLIPPFTWKTASEKVRLAENLWNSRAPTRVAGAYTEDSIWRNRNIFLHGRDEIMQFLEEKWERERSYRLIKELFIHAANCIAVRFSYEWHDEHLQWFRSYGNENWIFREDGLMQRRFASINDLPIHENERLFRWDLGPRPLDIPNLSELGL